jgi:hypothetical protein
VPDKASGGFSEGLIEATEGEKVTVQIIGETIHTPTKYIFYCKRAILFLSSSKILTPHPPLPLASLSSPRNKGVGYTLAGRSGRWRVNILEEERNRIALLQ